MADDEHITGAREGVLDDAKELICGDRNVQYGPPDADFTRTANLWNAYLGEGSTIDATDVAAMMALLKISRIRWSPEKRDHWVDLAGYSACGWDVVSIGKGVSLGDQTQQEDGASEQAKGASAIEVKPG